MQLMFNLKLALPDGDQNRFELLPGPRRPPVLHVEPDGGAAVARGDNGTVRRPQAVILKIVESAGAHAA